MASTRMGHIVVRANPKNLVPEPHTQPEHGAKWFSNFVIDQNLPEGLFKQISGSLPPEILVPEIWGRAENLHF